MDKPNKVIRTNNAAKNFSTIGRLLEEKAEKEEIPFNQAIDEFIVSLKKINNFDYNVEIYGITLTGFDRPLINDLIRYMNSVRKKYKQIENNDKKRKERERRKKSKEVEIKRLDNLCSEIVEKLNLIGNQESDIEKIDTIMQDINSGTYELDSDGKKYLTNKLQNLKEQINESIEAKFEEERKEEARKLELNKKVAKSWEEIKGIARKEGTKNPVKYWEAIREKLDLQEQDNSKDSKYVKSKLLQLIDERVEIEKDEEYFKQVEYFTRGFRFLIEYPETMDATAGRSVRKFTDKEAYERFCNLRLLLQKGTYSESGQISALLQRKDISSVDRRILEARKDVMNKKVKAEQGAR